MSNIGASWQAPPPDLWRDYRSALDGYERALRGLSYRDLLAKIVLVSQRKRSERTLTVNQIETLLHIDDKPHGYQLIEPAALPVFPSPPLQPPADQPLPLWRRIFWAPPKSCMSPVERQAQVERASKLQSESEALRLKFATQANRWVRVKQDCKAGEPEAIKVLMKVANMAHPPPEALQSDLKIDLDLGARIALATIDVPDSTRLQS